MLQLYADATESFSRSSRELTNAGLSYEIDMFDRLWKRTEEARQRRVEIRKSLTLHIATEHPPSES